VARKKQINTSKRGLQFEPKKRMLQIKKAGRRIAMATSSILRSVTVKNAGQCRKLVSALERAQSAKPKTVQISKTVHEMTPEQMKELFAKTNR